LAAVPIVSAEANSTPAVTPPVLGGGYAVQVTSERSERGAQAAFRALQAKYPNQLRGRQVIIRHADLGTAGTYYRALVGPLASAEKAAKLCRGLKAAGGDCIILKN
jgi:SPOR domain